MNYEPIDFKAKSWNNVFGKNATKEQINEALKVIYLFDPEVTLRMSYRLKYGRPPPEGSNMFNFLPPLRKLPKSMIVSRNPKLVSFGKPKSALNFTGRIQTKGTCWFQAIVNGWLLSKIGRKVIRERLNAFKKSSNVKSLTKNQLNACPSRKHIPQAYFWSYIEHMLNPKEWNTAFRMNVMRGIEFPESKLIRSSGLRSPNKSVVSGTVNDVRAFNDILFNNRSREFVESISFNNEEVPEKIGEWRLSHAYIAYSNHAIAGYIGFNGNPMIYDSNFKDPKILDWLKRPRNIIRYFNLMYPSASNTNKRLVVIGTYLRHYTHRGSTVPSPETRRFNKTTYDVKKYYRYQLPNYIRLFKNKYSHENFENKQNNYKRLQSPKTNKNRINLINFVIKPNSRIELRRLYRKIYGKNAHKNMTNANIKNAVQKINLS
jgi:hypothetical protein